MSGAGSVKTIGRILFWFAAWPVLAVIGAAVAVSSCSRFVSGLRRLARARCDTLVCPRGHANEVIGRWSCDACNSEYLGWVGACEICRDESADWFPCERCGLAIKLPWRPPP